MLGIDKKVSSSRHRDGNVSSRSRKNSSKKKLVLKKNDSERKETITRTKSGKIKISNVDNSKMY
jgi:hypothetical protein